MLCAFWTVSCGTGMIWRNFSLLFFCRLSPDLVRIDYKPFLSKPFGNSPVINTKFVNNTHVRVPTITEYNTTETRQSRLQCDRADLNRITFRQYLLIRIMPTVFERITSVSVGSLSGYCLISVGLHSVESGRSRYILGRILPGERYKLDKKRIENGIIGINSLRNG